MNCKLSVLSPGLYVLLVSESEQILNSDEKNWTEITTTQLTDSDAHSIAGV